MSKIYNDVHARQDRGNDGPPKTRARKTTGPAEKPSVRERGFSPGPVIVTLVRHFPVQHVRGPTFVVVVWHAVVVSALMSSVGAGGPPCPIHGDNTICTAYNFNNKNHSNAMT